MTIVGLKVRLDRPVDREQPCCKNICIIRAGKEPHAGALICTECGNHRGWISRSSAQWIKSVATHFGAPATITVRKASTQRRRRND